MRENFNRLIERVEKAAILSGRTLKDVQIIAVTKNASIHQMEEAYDLSLRLFGENRLQKALLKIPLFPKDVNWHFIGPIQSNKAIEISRHFSVLHSVSSLKIAQILSEEAIKQQKKIACFFQINSSAEVQKQGFSLEEFLSLEEDLLSLQGLDVQGLMTMPLHTSDEALIRRSFRSVFSLHQKKMDRYPFLSMGMTGDFEWAILEGATHIRIGSGLFS